MLNLTWNLPQIDGLYFLDLKYVSNMVLLQEYYINFIDFLYYVLNMILFILISIS